MNNESRVLPMSELKKEMIQMLECSDPHDPLTLTAFPENAKFSKGMKPLVGEVFFETDNEAIAHLLKTDPLYVFIKECGDEVLVEEHYEDDELAPYTIH